MITFQGIDLFCGAGGVTTGIENADYEGRKLADVVAAINHDPLAIESHASNHPGTTHFTEDIRTFDVQHLPEFSDRKNKRIFLWASLECTNFSNAKGGMPRDADSRTLANESYRYIKRVNPDYILIENVREFMAWGPLDDKGKPLSRKNGRDYLKWVETIKAMGYDFDFRLLNAADFGAYTSRIRYFAIFARKGLPISWPAATHSKKPNGLKPWNAVREVLDLHKEGLSIFDRDKPLVDRTLRRIYAGLTKYATADSPNWMVKYLSNDPKTGINSGASVDQPAPVITTQNRIYLAGANFLCSYYGSTRTGQSIDEPCPTLTTKDRISKICATTQWIDKNYRSEHNHSSVDAPAGTITANPKFALMSAPFLMPTNFTNGPRSIEKPCPTVTANRKHTYLVNPQYGNGGSSIDHPCFTLIARMDKRPPYLVDALLQGDPKWKIKPDDSPTMIKIKQFMFRNAISDIKMRMLNIGELKRITGFPDQYVLKGTKGDQKKFIGNAVPPVVPQKIFEALFRANNEIKAKDNYDQLPLMNAAI